MRGIHDVREEKEDGGGRVKRQEEDVFI